MKEVSRGVADTPLSVHCTPCMRLSWWVEWRNPAPLERVGFEPFINALRLLCINIQWLRDLCKGQPHVICDLMPYTVKGMR